MRWDCKRSGSIPEKCSPACFRLLIARCQWCTGCLCESNNWKTQADQVHMCWWCNWWRTIPPRNSILVDIKTFYTSYIHNTCNSMKQWCAVHLNRVELQNGCLTLAHANLFIPSNLNGSCFSPDTRKVDLERLKKNMDDTTDIYNSRTNACCSLWRYPDSTV